ncbi:hypothetical protein K438DRAFT_1760124 [Mycena galopus ATCC 62051]|nr:hypothetical protein K438DRAFT_1760124 [Mycena galopus ATCC 62051]
MASDLTLARRLFGRFKPHDDLNLRHLAALRKALEVIGLEQVRETLRQTTGLRMVMGTGGTSSRVGTVFISRVLNGRRVTLEYSVARAVQDQLVAYLDGYDSTYRKNGRTYLLLHPRADYPRQPLQHAEQAWHDWVVPYLAQRGRVRPEWALQPLPEMQRPAFEFSALDRLAQGHGGLEQVGKTPREQLPVTCVPRSEDRCRGGIGLPRLERMKEKRGAEQWVAAHLTRTVVISKGNQDAMLVSIEDIYSDSLRPSTPPPSRSPSPPPRKRNDAIPHLFFCRGPSGALDAELLAARYDQRARDEREEERARAAERAEAQCDAVSDFPHFRRYLCKPRLVDFMTTVKGVVLVGTQGRVPVLCFTRLAIHPRKMQSGRRGDSQSRRGRHGGQGVAPQEARLVPRPEEIPLAECRALLGFPQVSAGRRYEQHFDGLYLNDLVFVGPAGNQESGSCRGSTSMAHHYRLGSGHRAVSGMATLSGSTSP